MKSLSSVIAEILGSEGVISKQDVDACKFGLDYFIISILEILSVLLISIFVGNFIFTLLYFIFFIPLRMYSGGYHADSKLACYLILIAVYICFTLFIEYFPVNYYRLFEIISLVTCISLIFLLSPIPVGNRIYGKTEKSVYRHYSIRIVFLESIIVALGFIFAPESKFVISLSLGQFAVTISMVAAFVKNLFRGGETDE